MRASDSSGPRSHPRTEIRHQLRELRKTILTYRRGLAALAAALAVVAAMQVLRPDPPPATQVVVASRDVAAGAVLTASDLDLREYPTEVVARDALTGLDSTVGEVVTTPLRAGEILTDVRVLGPGLLDGYPGDHTLATVRVADPASVWGVEPGRSVTITGTEVQGDRKVRVLAARAEVVATPAPSGSGSAGLAEGAVVIVSVPHQTALTLAAAAVRLSVGVHLLNEPERAP